MPAPTFPTAIHDIGPGYLYYAAIGTTEPASTVVGSVFTDTITSGSIFPLGYTDDGHVFEFGTTTSVAEAAESPDPLAYSTDARSGVVSFGLIGNTATNFKRVFNGGTITVTGATTTTKSVYTPPDLGAEIRCMLFWESTDFTQRYVWRQCFAGGTSSAIARRKGAANRTVIPATFNLELPATGSKLFDYITAGTARA